jgi:predicted glycoside hydrolase/deacetylase ChbG (UPF0249 family)
MIDVVLNADDLGMGPGVDEGIAACVAAGTVREVSVCVTGATAAAGIRRVLDAGDAGLGLHFSVTWGTALTGPLRGLTDARGRFRPLRYVLAACAARLPDPDQIARELLAQHDALVALGVEPTHVDGHHHVHAFPVVRSAFARVLADRTIGHLRIPIETTATARAASPRRLLITHFGRGLARSVEAIPAARRPATLRFVGLGTFEAPEFETAFRAAAHALDPTPTEWMVHPAADDPRRAQEVAFLSGPDALRRLESLGLTPRRYRDVVALPGPA